jgi:hypothetical protein
MSSPPATGCQKGDGVLFALKARGFQDQWMGWAMAEKREGPVCDLRATLLPPGKAFNFGYGRLATSKKVTQEEGVGRKKTVVFELQRDCDLVDGIDLQVLLGPGLGQGTVTIHSVESMVGGQRHDKVAGADVPRILDTTCELMRDPRRTRILGDTMTVPLPLAPFAGTSFAVLRALKWHRVEVRVVLSWPEGGEASDASDDDDDRVLSRLHLLGRRYHVEGEMPTDLEWLVSSHQSWPKKTLAPGANRIKLYLNHPGHSLFLHGPGLHARDVKRLRVVFPSGGVDYVLADCTGLELAYAHAALTPGAVPDPDDDRVFVHFSQEALGAATLCTVNHSRLDYSHLEIDYDAGDRGKSIEVDLVAYNLQGVRCTGGMEALIYSK